LQAQGNRATILELSIAVSNCSGGPKYGAHQRFSLIYLKDIPVRRCSRGLRKKAVAAAENRAGPENLDRPRARLFVSFFRC
jgi:hypothetical protein